MQKYPNKEVPYRYRRRKPASCCTSRKGELKAFFRSQQRAQEKCDYMKKKWGHDTEPYPCLTIEGRWHIRTKRGKK